MANLQIVISALDKASGDINKIKSEISGVNSASKDATKGTGDFTTSITSMMSKAALAAGAVAAVGMALKGVYDSAKEAAELDYARSKFDNLSTSIGTVSDALLIDLRAATSGMVSDADLIAGAGDFMALGLAKTHDEVVRLSTVAGALNMNMNQLVLTLTNQTTMRFDALGVSVDGFDEKVKALEKSGMSASDAFTEAFLQQAEEQIATVGSAADKTIGSFMRFEAASDNLAKALKGDLATALAPVVDQLAEMMNVLSGVTPVVENDRDAMVALNQAMADGTISGDEYTQIVADLNRGFITAQEAINKTKPAIVETSESIEAQTMAIFENTNSWAEFKSQMESAGIDLGMLTEDVYNSEKGIVRFSSALNITEQSMNFKKNIDLMKENMTSLMDQLSGAQLELDIAIKTFRENVASDLVEGLRKAGLEGEELEKRLKVLDEMFGTSYTIEYKMELATGELLQALLDDPESFKAKYSGFEAEFLINDEQVVAAQEKVDTLQETIDDLTSRTYTITFAFRSTGGLPIPGDGVGMFPRAAGGPVSAGNPYLWQEYGYRGEKFVPAQNGYVLSRSDAARAVANTNAAPVYSGPSAADIALAVRDAILMAGWR